jgi:GAF domain-containing protein
VADVDVASADLARQLEDAREQQRAVGRVLRALARSEGLQPVLDEVIEASARLCEGEYAALYLARGDLLYGFSHFIPEDRSTTISAAAHEQWRMDQEQPHARDRTTLAGRAALTGDVVHIPDLLADPEYSFPLSGGSRAGLGVPVFVEDELIGTMVIVRDLQNPFSEEDIEVVKTFANQAAIAIANARLLETVERKLEQQRAVSDVLRAVARSGGLQPVLDKVVEEATRLCDASNGRLWLFRDGRLHVVANCGSTEGLEYDRENPALADRSTMAGRAALTREIVHLPDVLEDPEYTWGGPLHFRSGLNVPILLEEELIGVFGVVREQVGPFPDEQIELVKTFADQAAIAITNARLIDAVERQLEQQRAISDVLDAVARSEGLEAVFAAVVDAATRLCHGDYGALYLQEGDVLRVVTQHYGQPDLYAYEREHPHTIDRSTVIGRAALTREVVHIPDTRKDPEYTWGGAGITEYRALLGAPILVEDEFIGAMNVVRIAPEPFAEEHIELMKTFADQAAIAIANARLLDAVERQKTELSRFVSPQVAELVSSEEGEKLLAGHRAYISVCFCDLRGFTAFAETAAPEELFEVLRDYHGGLGELISRHEGTLEHFAGDGVMVFFNDPVAVDDHELQAICFALAAQERFAELAQTWRKRGIELGLGIGIASGYATLGRIGFEGRYDYGALGPDTSLASRLSTQAEPGQTLISQRVFAAVEEQVEAEPVGDLELKGFARPVGAYEVRALRQ